MWATVGSGFRTGQPPESALFLTFATYALAETPTKGLATPDAPGVGETAPAASREVSVQGEDVVVESSRPAGPDPMATSASVTVLRPDDRTAASADVAALLDTATGVTVQRLGGLGDYAAISIRGSSLRQVEVFLDGIPLNPDGTSVVNLAELPLAGFERIEVWRGNAPATFGSTAIGGVVNLVSRDPARASPTGGNSTANRGEGQVAYGTWDTARASVFDAGSKTFGNPMVGLWTLDGQGFAEAFQTRGDFEYFDDNATIYNRSDDAFRTRGNNDKLQLNAYVRARASTGPWRFSLLDAPLSRDEGIPGIAQAPASAARLSTFRNLLSGQVEWRGSAVSVTGTAWNLWREETLDDREGEVGSGNSWTRAEIGNTGGRVTATWAPKAWLVAGLTLGARHDSFADEDLVGEIDPTNRGRMSYTGSASADFRFFGDRLTISPVLAATLLDNRLIGEVSDRVGGGADTPVVDGSVDPRLGVLLRPASWLAFRANGGRYLRPPDLTELFGDSGSLHGNPELLPERGWSADFGARSTLKKGPVLGGSVDLSAFWLVSENRIIYVQNSQRTLYPVNFGNTWVQGIEAALEVDLLSWVDSQTSLTWTLSRNLTEGSQAANNELPRTPSLEVWQATSVHWRNVIRIGHTFAYTAPNYWDATNLYLSAPREVHGLFLKLKPTPRWPEIAVDCLNLTDTMTAVVPQNPADPEDTSRMVTAVTDYVSFPLPGRTLLASVRWAF